jgi:chorismate dehydratase
MEEYHIISDYCIGAEGPVASVCLFSDVPLHDIKRIYLDYQSRSSVALCRLLVRDYWKLDVEFLPATEGYEAKIGGTDAGVVIGDRAFNQRLVSPLIYDLAEHWIRYTNLPMVFAAWISNKALPIEFIQQFNNANSIGLNSFPEVVAENPYDKYDLLTYYTQNLSFPLTPSKRQGMQRFVSYLQ